MPLSLIVHLLLHIPYCLLFATVAIADFQMAIEAFNRGDYSLAIEEARSVAKEGTAEEQIKLGALFSDPEMRNEGWFEIQGNGVRLVELAANRGNAEGMRKLGLFYRFGLFVPKDEQEALRWTKLAAEKGSLSAQIELARRYRIGEDVPKDEQEAANWTRLAAEQGSIGPQFDMALRYSVGKGVLKDYVMAHMWSNLAAANGHEESTEIRELMELLMTQEQVAEAQRLAREWLAQHKK